MASKFQNRLVGTVILVALGVIILPGLLDGKKKHYEDEFAAIPLVPKAGDVEENDVLPPVTQPLPRSRRKGRGRWSSSRRLTKRRRNRRCDRMLSNRRRWRSRRSRRVLSRCSSSLSRNRWKPNR